MKKQDFINLVNSAIDKLEKQGEPCKGEYGNCVYLNDKNQCCIVGHMMPDDETRKDADDCDFRVYGLFHYGMEWTKQFDKEQIKIMTSLQDDHDSFGVGFNAKIKTMREIIAEYEAENDK